jgi:hypothetical protein
MMSVSVFIVQKENHLPGLGDRWRARADVIDTKAAFDAWSASKPYTPVRTGHLINAVTVTPAAGGRPATVHWHAHYAAYQEFGTVRGVTPKRFAAQGVEHVKPSWLAAHRQLARMV